MITLEQCGIDGIQVFKSGAKTAAGARFLEQVASGEIFSENESAQELAKDQMGTPSEDSSRFVNQERTDAIQAVLESELGSQYLRETEENLARLLGDADINIRVAGDVLDAIIDSGRIKTAYESAKTADEGYIEGRLDREEFLFSNLPEDLSQRPIYGYFASSDTNGVDHAGARRYGDVVLSLRPEVKSRSTFAGSDTWAAGPPAPVNRPRATSLDSIYGSTDERSRRRLDAARTANNISEYVTKAQTPYMEAQVHGQVKTSDIARITFTNGRKPSDSQRQWARANGVEIVEQ